MRQRESALEPAEIDDAPVPTSWRLRKLPADDEAIAAVARDVLLAHGPLRLPGRGGTKYEHLNTWLAALDEAGVLVLASAGGRVATTEMNVDGEEQIAPAHGARVGGRGFVRRGRLAGRRWGSPH